MAKFLGVQAAIMQPSCELCTLIAWMWHDFCAHVDLINQPMDAFFNIKMARQDIVKTLEYSPVIKIPETEGLLVCQCSARLGEFGLTLWVVSFLMYDLECHHKKLFFFFVSCHIVKVKTCHQSKDADSKFAWEKDAKGNLQPTIFVYEKD